MTDPFTAPTGVARSARAEERVKRDQWKRYLLPDPDTGEEVPWTRVSTIKSLTSDQYGLNQWFQRQAVRGVAMRPDLLALASSVADMPDDDKGAKDTLRNVVKQAQAAAGSGKGANLGTALHHATERLDRGERLQDIRMPKPYDADLYAYDQVTRANGLITAPSHIERIVVIPSLRIAGTFDRLTFWRGTRKVNDVKTGQDAAEFGTMELAIQEALYSRGYALWNLDTEQYEQMPEVDQELGILTHLPAGRGVCELYWVDLTRGWELAQRAAQVHHDQKEARDRPLVVTIPDLHRTMAEASPAAAHVERAVEQGLGRLPERGADWLHGAIGSATDQGYLAALLDDPNLAPLWTPANMAYGQQRWVELNAPAEQTAQSVELDQDWAHARDALAAQVLAAGSHEELMALREHKADVWDDALTELAARRWQELAEAMQLKALSDTEIGGPSLFAKRVLNARTREELGALYEDGMAGGEWTEEIATLAFAVMAAYVELCPTLSIPHGETLSCGCGYKRPEVLGAYA